MDQLKYKLIYVPKIVNFIFTKKNHFHFTDCCYKNNQPGFTKTNNSKTLLNNHNSRYPTEPFATQCYTPICSNFFILFKKKKKWMKEKKTRIRFCSFSLNNKWKRNEMKFIHKRIYMHITSLPHNKLYESLSAYNDIIMVSLLNVKNIPKN